MTPERRVRWYLRAFMWLLAPVSDSWKGLSLTRLITIFMCFLLYHEVVLHERALSYVDLWFALAAIANAYGKKVFTFFLTRVGLKSESVDVKQDVKIDVRTLPNAYTDDERG